MNTKKLLISLFAGVIGASALTVAAMAAEEPTGTITPAYVSSVGVWGEATTNSETSLVVKLYSGKTLIAEKSLNDVDNIIDGDVFVTWTFFTGNKNDNDVYWNTKWYTSQLLASIEPTHVDLYVDGEKVATNDVKFHGPDGVNPNSIEWKDVAGVNDPCVHGVYLGGSYSKAYLCVEVNDFDLVEDSFAVDYYYDDEKLATATLVKGKLSNGHIDTIGCCLGFTESYDEYWNTEWYTTPHADKIPNGIKVYSNGQLITEDYDVTPGNYIKGWDPESNGNWLYALIADDYVNIPGVVSNVMIGDKYYGTLAGAVNASKDGDEIKLVGDVSQKDGVTITDKKLTINLNGNSFAVSEGSSTNSRNLLINGNSDVVIKNGTLIADGELNSGTYGTVRTEGSANVVLDDLKLYNYRGNGLNIKALGGTTVTVTDTEIYSTYGGGIESAGGEIELTNVTVEQKGMWSAPYNSMAISVNGGGTVTVNSGTYTTEPLAAADANNQGTSHGSWAAGVLNSGGKLIIKGGTFANGNFGDDSLATNARGLLFADKGGNIEVNGGTFNALKYVFDLQNNLGVTPNPHAEISGGVYNVDPRIVTPSYNTDKLEIADGYTVLEYADGNYAVVADEFIGNESITVDFVDVTENDAEGEKVYNINLVADDEKIINRLNSADLTFVLNVDSGAIDYEIVDIKDDNIVVNPVDNSKNRYEFHFETKTDVTNDTDDTITIAQVKFTGYGTFDFAVNTEANGTNAVHATKILDNIVDTYVPAGATQDTTAGELIFDNDDIENVTINVPTRKLVINVDFPNSAEKNAAAYQQMTVTVSGGDLTKDIVINLGDTAIVDEAVELEAEKPTAKFSVDVATDDKYVVTVEEALTVNNSYNVEVSGAGYRTARYTVTMNCDDYKTLNFWNNVKDNKVEVEEGKETSAKNVTFLAGDIVKDSVINIYDLSAVVSYFGEIDLDEDNKPEYAKYDLNRDGKIDSKDVAYVLVSWNN